MLYQNQGVTWRQWELSNITIGDKEKETVVQAKAPNPGNWPCFETSQHQHHQTCQAYLHLGCPQHRCCHYHSLEFLQILYGTCLRWGPRREKWHTQSGYRREFNICTAGKCESRSLKKHTFLSPDHNILSLITVGIQLSPRPEDSKGQTLLLVYLAFYINAVIQSNKWL